MPEERDVVMLTKPKKIRLSILFDTIAIELVCSDEYEAAVPFDDLKDRLDAGQEISIDPGTPGKEAP